MKNKRKIEIDIVKGIGIILMIIGHIFPGSAADKWLHGFHMPMFFILSGILFNNKKDTKSSLIGKTKSLIIPYLSISFFHLLIYALIEFRATSQLKETLRYFINIFWINDNNIAICGAVWFLTAFFITNLIGVFTENYVKNNTVKYLVYIFLAMIGVALARLNIHLPLSICQGLIGCGFFLFGRLIKESNFITNANIFYGILGMTTGTALIELNYPVNMRMLQCVNEVLFFINPLIITISFLIIANYFKNINSITLKEIAFIGENSIIYLGLNQLCIVLLNNVISNRFIKLILILLFIKVLSLIINNSKLKIFFGKK